MIQIEAFTGSDDEMKTEAIRGLVGLVGGVAGLLQNNISMAKLNIIREADLSDPGIRGNLEFLAIVAARSRSSSALNHSHIKDYEPHITPDIAKRWLIDTGRAKAIDDSLELLEEDKNVHISIAALAIAHSTEQQLLSETYAQIGGDLSPSMIADMSRNIVAKYTEMSMTGSYNNTITITANPSYL
ncbi:MAG: hypothetical protein ACXWLH_03910 [Candidatus Saccharimonadales bacterium]